MMDGREEKQMWYFTHYNFGAMLASRILGFVSTLSLLGIGAYMHSILLQFVGFVFFCLALVTSYARAKNDRSAFASPQELADELKRRFGVTAR